MIFVGASTFSACLQGIDDVKCYDINYLDHYWSEILTRLGSGDALIYVGTLHLELLRDLWVESFAPHESARLDFCPTPFQLPENATLKLGGCRCVHIQPKSRYLCHGTDEEYRANIIPIAEVRGKYGEIRGYPAVMLKNYASSLVTNRYRGSNWYLFLFEDVLEVMSEPMWHSLVASILDYERTKCYIAKLHTEFPIYGPGDRIRIDCMLTNLSGEVQSTITKLESVDDNGNSICAIGEVERCLNPDETLTFSYDWYLTDDIELINIRATLFQQNRFVYGLARESTYHYLDREQCLLLVKPIHPDYPVVTVSVSSLQVGESEGFLLGTNYYPSSSWWDGSWRYARCAEMKRDLQLMSDIGIKFIRLWIDPILDEASLRGLDACIELCRRNGFAVELCIFTQWVRWIEANLPGLHGRSVFKDLKDDALHSVFLHNTDFQTRYLATLVRRYRDQQHLIWDITNEFSIVNPSPDQVDRNWIGETYLNLPAPYNSVDLFHQWVTLMTNTIRQEGSTQPIITGNAHDFGCDNYLANKVADISVVHSYTDGPQTALGAIRYNTTCLGTPLFAEEFGWWKRLELIAGASDEFLRFQQAQIYEIMLYYYLGSNVVGACSYEWGVSWLTEELPYFAPAVKYNSHIPINHLPALMLDNTYGQSWPLGSIGICPWAASFEFGMNYACTAGISPVMEVYRRLSYIKDLLVGSPREESVYLVVPMEFEEFAPHIGYRRKSTLFSQTVFTLWKHGVAFGVWQEDMLSRIPASARVVFFPNEEPLKSETQEDLQELAKRGVGIYLQDDKSWTQDHNIERIIFEPSNAYLLVRRISGGTAYILTNLDDQSHIKLALVCGMLETSLSKQGLFAVTGSALVLAESEGRVVINGEEVASSSGGRYILRSHSGSDLRDSDTIDVIAHTPMVLHVNPRFASARVIDSHDSILGEFVLHKTRDKTVLDIDKGMVSYKVRLSI